MYTCVYCCCSVGKLWLALCGPMNCSTSGFPVLYYLPEFSQTHICWISDAILSSHPLSPSSPLAPNLSQHQGLFQWVGSSYQVTKVLRSALASVLPMNIQGWYPLGLTSLISVQSKGLSKSFLTPQFESISSSVLSPLCGPTLTSIHDYWKDHNFHYMDFFGKVMSLLFNVMSRFVIAFLLSSKCLLTSWPQSTGPWTHLFLHELNPWL